MKHSTTEYWLTKGDEIITFLSEKQACEFLSVARCSVSSCCRSNSKCKGYSIKKIGRTTHGETKTRLYKIWCCMHERCERVKHTHFKSYGDRGISVCKDWSGDNGFENFRAWALANGYSEQLTIDRIDNEGNYSPSNCRWATMKEQQNNKRTNHFVNARGILMTISQCSEKYGIPKSTVRWRDDHYRDVITGAKMRKGEQE